MPSIIRVPDVGGGGGGGPPSGAAGGDLAGTYPNPTVDQASNTFALRGDLSPAQITASQNNYNPASLSSAAILRLDSDATWEITGLAGGADGRLMVLVNVGAFGITITDEDASSTAANRFALGTDVTINANQSFTLIYDSTSSRWRPFSGVGVSGAGHTIRDVSEVAQTPRTNLDFNTGFTVIDDPGGDATDIGIEFGTITGTVCEGDDARLSDSRAPSGAASGDLGGNYPSPDVLSAGKSFARDGVISPAQLTGNQNDWTPTGLSDASVIRLSTDASRTITGLTGGASGRIMTLLNVGSNNAVLSNEDASSTAANRFALSGGNITLTSGQTITLIYDNTSSRWRPAANFTTATSSVLYRRDIGAVEFDDPNNSDWAVNAQAALAAGSVNASLLERLFDDTTEEGVGFDVYIPTGVTSITFRFMSRAISAATAAVVPKLYAREIEDNTVVETWPAGTVLTAIDIPNTARWQYDSQTITLSTLGLTAGNRAQFELTRVGTNGSDTLTGDWALLSLHLEMI